MSLLTDKTLVAFSTGLNSITAAFVGFYFAAEAEVPLRTFLLGAAPVALNLAIYAIHYFMVKNGVKSLEHMLNENAIDEQIRICKINIEEAEKYNLSKDKFESDLENALQARQNLAVKLVNDSKKTSVTAARTTPTK